MRINYAILGFSSVLLLFALELQAQSSKTKVAVRSLAQIADELRPEYGGVRFHREEELEDRFIVRAWPASALAVAPHIFQIQARQFDFVGGSTTVRIRNGLPIMYLATSSDELAYKLAGFPSAEQEFSRLVSEHSQKLRTKSEAESRGLLCAEIVYGLSPAWWVDGASSAKLQAAKHFFNEGHDDGLLLTEKWWESFSVDPAKITITTTKTKDTFSVHLPVFWAPVEVHSAPEIRMYRIEVSENGTCHMEKPGYVQALVSRQ
jgi:hypothetical protein